MKMCVSFDCFFFFSFFVLFHRIVKFIFSKKSACAPPFILWPFSSGHINITSKCVVRAIAHNASKTHSFQHRVTAFAASRRMRRRFICPHAPLMAFEWRRKTGHHRPRKSKSNFSSSYVVRRTETFWRAHTISDSSLVTSRSSSPAHSSNDRDVSIN